MSRGPRRAFSIKSPFDQQHGPAAIRGVSWQRRSPQDEWIRNVMRIHKDGTAYWSKTTRLEDINLPFCPHCLSQAVTFEGGSPDDQTWHCHTCDIGNYRIINCEGMY